MIILMFVSIIFMLIGLTFYFFSMYFSKNEKKKRELCICKTEGIVLRIEKQTTSATSSSVPMTSWFPVYEYSVGDQKIVKRSQYGQGGQKFYEGQKVIVFYNPSNWNEFYVPEEETKNLLFIFTFIGILFFILGLFVLFLIYFLLN